MHKNILVRIHEGKILLGIHSCRWEDNIGMNPKAMVGSCVVDSSGLG
jgi:hypothetical protein